MHLFISNSGECLPIAWRMQNEGAKVAVYLHSPQYRRNYDGLIEKVQLSGLKKALNDCETVIFDITRDNQRTREDLALLKLFKLKASSPSVFGPVGDKLKSTHRVIGASEWCEEIEMNRFKGSQIAGKIGMKISETHDFKTTKEGAKFLAGQKDRWVLKPHDNKDLDLTYVEQYPGELAEKLKSDLPRRLGTEQFAFMVQKFVEGVEISTEAWYNGRSFSLVNHTIEDKKFLAGNLGPAVGSMNNTVWGKQTEGLLTKELTRLEPWLSRASYVGPIDINAIVAEKDQKPYFLEFSPRFGWDALYCLLRLYQGPVSAFFASDFTGKLNGFASSTRISIPPYPYADKSLLNDLAKGVTITNNPGNLKEFWAQDIARSDAGFVCAGSDGILGVMTGAGASLGESVGRVYQGIKKLRVGATLQYRTDLGKRAEKALTTLKRWGVNVR